MRAAALTVLLAAAEALSAPKPRSRLFLDSASLADWQELLPTGLFYGVTTNPTILARDGVSCDVKSVSALARRAVEDYGCRQVMFQAWGGSADLFERSALEVLDKVNLGEHVIVKLPLTRQGVVASDRLDEAHLCMTACYAREQAVVANALRADYLAPYLGRMRRPRADVACDVEDEAACIQEAPKNKMIDVAKILGKKKEAA
ncbi:transaldolase/fructose-6-phosphate aldolase [Aureococcus anophagefferens]|nr:transaldolase/fructose-6-phosphate aldolase [Aureococcus anophagefferens]